MPLPPRQSAPCEDPANAASPVSELRISKLRFLDSNFPGNSLWAWEFHPLEIQILLESEPLKSRILVRRLGVRLRCCISTSD